MTEVQRRLAVGERVISVRPLVIEPVEPHGVRTEIPVATCGVVVDTHPYDYPAPYIVKFEIGTGTIEANADESDVMSLSVQSPAELYGVTEVKGAAYTPTYTHPHRWCRALHATSGLLFAGIYGAALGWYTTAMVVLTILFMVVMYAYQYWAMGTWSWTFQALKRDQPNEDEMLLADPVWIKRCLYVDIATAVSQIAFLADYAIFSVNPDLMSVEATRGLFIGLAVVAGVTLLAELHVHEKAVRIVPKTNERGRKQ